MEGHTVEFWQFISGIGLISAVIGFCFWLLERKITKREDAKEKEAAERRKKAEAKERNREDMEIIILRSTSAAIALGEATAKAVQRIPDANCNGDMHAALEYATTVKHEQKDFLTKLGVKAVID